MLSAARQRFLRDGVDGASLRGIAADAGTSIGMVYYYFPTKDELFFGVVEQLYQSLLADLEQACASEVPVQQRLERLLARMARLSEDELLALRLVVREMLTASSRFERLRERFRTGHVALAVRLVADGYQSKTFDVRVHPMVTLLSLAGLALVPALARRVLDEPLPFPETPAGEELSKLLVGVLLHGTGASTRP